MSKELIQDSVTKIKDFADKVTLELGRYERERDVVFKQLKAENEKLIAQIEKVKEAAKFMPDCGGDYCCLVDPSICDVDGDGMDCPHKGYCKYAFRIEEALKGEGND